MLANQINGLNQVLSKPTNPSQLRQLLSRRAELFSALIASDPAAAASLALPQDIVQQLQADAPAGTVESRGEWRGHLTSTVADDFEHHRSHARWYLNTPAGNIELFFGGHPAPPLAKAMTIRGVRLGDRLAVESSAATDPRLVLGDTATASAQAPCTTTGPQHIAVLMLTMPSNPTFPTGYTAASLREAFFGSASDTSNMSSLNGFWKEVSYGQTSATGQVFGPFALTQDYTYDTQSGLSTEAIQIADQTVDLTQFTRLALVFPISSWGGFAADDSIGCWNITSPSKGGLAMSIGWLPAFPNSPPYVPIYDHELGHALGLGHSSSDDYGSIPLGPLDIAGALTEYGDPFSTMGSNSGHYPAEHKSILHWLTPGSGYQEVASSGTFTLLPFESTGDPRALRVLRDPTTSAWLWVEYRQPLGDVDKTLQAGGYNVFSGASIRYEDPNLDSLHTYLLDFNAVSTPNNFGGANLTPGHSWSDPYSLLTLTVNSANAGGLQMAVNYDQPCASLLISSTSFAAAGDSGAITVTAPGTCAWTASTGTSWIALNGATSGHGNGTVSFVVAANTGAKQRNGSITVQRQSTGIVQKGSGISVLSVTPAWGMGNTGQFTFQLYDAAGYKDVTYTVITFSGSPACYLEVYPSSNQIYLSADDGSLLGPIHGNTAGGVESNNECSVSSSGSSISGSGNQLQITLQLNFFAAFGGAHRITAYASNSAVISLGTWVVPTVQQPAVTITANTTGAVFTLDGTVYQAPLTFYSQAGSQHTISWLTTSPTLPGARFTFQGWADGSSANPRTITTVAGASAYTANIAAQYQLTLSASPAEGGSLTAAPASPDGYYASGQVVPLTATPASGYYFAYFNGDASGNTSPVTVTMDAPRSVGAIFSCQYQFPHGMPSLLGSGPTVGLIQWQTGTGCSWSMSSDSAWLTLGIPASGLGSGTLLFSIPENTGPSRAANVNFTGNAISFPMSTTQVDPSVGRPAAVSITPNSGAGSSQTFTLQFHDPTGFANITYGFVEFDSVENSAACRANFYPNGSQVQISLSDDAGSGGSFQLPSTGVLRVSQCELDGPHSSVSASGKLLNVTLALTFLPGFSGAKGVTAWAYDSPSNIYAYTEMLGTWTVPAAVEPAIAIQSNVSGAPFSLEDGSVYQAPITFHWPTGAQHTVTWLSALAGKGNVRYAFGSWSDSVSANSRTITVAASDATYTANLTAQYLLKTAASPVAGGSMTANPPSADGFYNSGQSVSVTATAAAGYYFWYLTGDVSDGSSPQTVTMDEPRTITGYFFCDYQFAGYLPGQVGPGPISGMLIWRAGAGCQTTATSSAAWLTLGAQIVVNGYNAIPYSIPENTGASQAASVTFSGDYSGNMPISQDAAGAARPNAVSVSPNSGNAATQVFTLQAYHASGYAALSQLDLSIRGADSLECSVIVTGIGGAGGSGYLWLNSDAGTFLTPLTLPGTGTLENSQCKLDAATSSVSGAGKLATIHLGVTFKTAFAGSRYITGQAYDSAASIWGPNVVLGTWTVIGSPPSLSLTKTPDAAIVVAGSAIGYTIAAGNSSVAGTSQATAVTLNDPLPAGAGVNWSISPAYSGPGTCTVTGAVGSQTLACSLGNFAAGASASVHVTSETSPLSCHAYVNTATLASSNTGSLQSTANTTVQCPALSVSGPASLPTPVANVAYPATTMTATGGSGVYSWTAAGLPTGLSIDATMGTIAGTPTASAGTQFAVHVTVTDSNSLTASANYTLTVNNPLAIFGPPWMPQGTANSLYPVEKFAASGGGGAYVWSASGLPPGLNIDPNSGAISGIPVSTAGSPFQVQVTVKDSYAITASLTYSVTIGVVSPCDPNHDASANVHDVQLMINEALGVGSAIHDLTGDGSVGVADVQIAINAAYGLGCMVR